MSTVKVRIAVAVDENGRWYAQASSTETDEQIIDGIPIGWLSPHAAIRWITAEIPIPQVPTIEATVEVVK